MPRSAPQRREVHDMHHVPFLLSIVRPRGLVSERDFGTHGRIALNQWRREQLTQHLLKSLPVDPIPLVVVTLSQRESEQPQTPAARQGCIRCLVIKRCLGVAGVMLGTS